MKKLLILFVISFAFTQCNDDQKPNCSTRATVRDLTGLDGCGVVFELENGTRLEPELILRCGTPPLVDNARPSNDNALLGFEFEDGMPVLISYEEIEGASSCMVGPRVRITCIQEVAGSKED